MIEIWRQHYNKVRPHSSLGYRPPAPETLVCARNVRHPLVGRIANNVEQLLDTIASHRGDNPKLGEMSADRIDHRGLLADEQMARTMEHQTALLLSGLGLDEPHVGSGDCLADRFRVSGIVLLPFDVRFYVSRRHQPHGATECFELA